MAEDTNLISEPSKVSPRSTAKEDSVGSDDSAFDQLKTNMDRLLKQLEDKDAQISVLHEHILSLETEIPKSKKRKFNSNDQAEDEEEELDNLRRENEQLKRRLDKLTSQETSSKEPSHNEHNQNARQDTILVNLINEKLGEGLEKIKDNLEKLISSKLEVVTQQSKQETIQTTFAAAVGSKDNNHVGGSLRKIMMETKNEELTEEAERKRRGKNIIIHGVKDQSNNENEDKVFVKRLLTNLQVGAINFDSVERLGPETDDNAKVRPLKVMFKTENEQQKILKSLGNLKGNIEYMGVSIKEDYTFSERQFIRSYVEKAKALNALEETKTSNTIWRVRGTPKNGLTLKRFTKKKDQVQGQNGLSTL